MSDGVYALHAVIVKKPVELAEAKRIAADIINDPKREFFRETGTSVRFRNISKQKFVPKTFRTKKVNKQVSLVFGRLRPEWEHLEGGGLFDIIKSGVSKVKEFFKPRLDDYNNKSKETLRQYGGLAIKRLQIMRTPISGMLNTALNLVSLGKWEELRKKYGFDELFHLALVANVGAKNVIMEKNEVVNISTEYKTSKDTEVFEVDLGGRQVTPYEMLETARKNVGDKTFFEYDAVDNNCIWFVRYLLEGQGLYTQAAADFLFKDVAELFKALPSYVPKVVKAVTTTGAIFNKITGQGADDGVAKKVETEFPSVMNPVVTQAFYDYVKKKAKDQSVGIYFIQQLYPKFMRSKEFKAALSAVPEPKPKGTKGKKAPAAAAPGKQEDITKFFKKKGGARGSSTNPWILALRRWNESRGYKKGAEDSAPWCVPRGKDSKEYKEVKAIMDEIKAGKMEGGAMSAPQAAWLEGVKWFNSRSKGTYCMPVKGTPEYDDVRAYQMTKLKAPASLWRIADRRPTEGKSTIASAEKEGRSLLFNANEFNDKAAWDKMSPTTKKGFQQSIVDLLVRQAAGRSGKLSDKKIYDIIKDWKPNRKLPPSVTKEVAAIVAEREKEKAEPKIEVTEADEKALVEAKKLVAMNLYDMSKAKLEKMLEKVDSTRSEYMRKAKALPQKYRTARFNSEFTEPLETYKAIDDALFRASRNISDVLYNMD